MMNLLKYSPVNTETVEELKRICGEEFVFFDNKNVVPKWIVGNYTDPYYDEESGEWTAGLITTVRFRIRNK